MIGEGFEVKYKVEDGGVCVDCEVLKGRCGFDFSINKILCFCFDGSVGYVFCSYIEVYVFLGLFFFIILD